jgi:cold shock protein
MVNLLSGKVDVSNRDSDFRPGRRRDFADDSPSGPAVKATVKWYNPSKGFGFVELADCSGDAFLHVSVVERSGHGSVPPGATLEIRVGPGPKGMQVT